MDRYPQYLFSFFFNQFKNIGVIFENGFDELTGNQFVQLTINGIVRAKEFIADKITAKELCLEDVCVNKEQLKQLLEKNQISPIGPIGEEEPSAEVEPPQEVQPLIPTPEPGSESSGVSSSEGEAATGTSTTGEPNGSTAESVEPLTTPGPTPEPEPEASPAAIETSEPTSTPEAIPEPEQIESVPQI